MGFVRVLNPYQQSLIIEKNEWYYQDKGSIEFNGTISPVEIHIFTFAEIIKWNKNEHKTTPKEIAKFYE